MVNFPAWYWFTAFCIMGVVSLVLVANMPDEHIQELGQSICDQEYNMDYERYSDGELTCKPKEVKAEVQYDGIVIQIKES